MDEEKAVKKQTKSSRKTAPKAANNIAKKTANKRQSKAAASRKAQKNVIMSSRMKYVAPPTNRATRSSGRPLVAPLQPTSKRAKNPVKITTTQTIPTIVFSKHRRRRNRTKATTAKERAENKTLPTARRVSLGQSIRRAITLKRQNFRRRGQTLNRQNKTPNRDNKPSEHNSNLSALANELKSLKIKSRSRSRSQSQRR